MKQNIFKRSNLFSIGTFIGCFAFYLFFAFYDGAVICVDSPTYISMSFTREPIYPLILAFFRQFDANNYLFYTVIFQSILAAISGWILADYLRKKLDIHPIYSLILYLMPLCASLLCRFVAARSSMYTNSIMTEGIATSLYLLFIYFLLKYVLEKSKSALISCCVLSFIMISTRKQMFMVLPLLIVAVCYVHLKNKTLKKGILKSIVFGLLILCSVKLFDCGYNYILRGQFEGHSSGNRFVSTMIFYNAEPSDAEYIEDLEVREIFLKIYDACDKAGYIGSHAKAGWLEEVSHFGAHYDHIQINTMWPMIMEHAKNTINESYNGTNMTAEELQPLYDLETDRINSIIIKSVLVHQIPDLVKTLYNNFLSGLVTTVAQRTPILIVYSVFIYLAYIVLLIRLVYMCAKKKAAYNLVQQENTIIFAIITLFGIFFNVGLVSAVIFCQTRYTIYNMPLFYMAGAVLLYYNVLVSIKHREK